MAEVADTKKAFLVRQRIANGQRQRGELLANERPADEVVSPLVRQEKTVAVQTAESQAIDPPVKHTHPILLCPSAKPAAEEKTNAFAAFSGPVVGHCTPMTNVTVNAEAPPTKVDKQLAFANIQRTMMEFEQARAVLHTSSGGMSPAIPLLRAVFDDLMTALPAIKP